MQIYTHLEEPNHACNMIQMIQYQQKLQSDTAV